MRFFGFLNIFFVKILHFSNTILTSWAQQLEPRVSLTVAFQSSSLIACQLAKTFTNFASLMEAAFQIEKVVSECRQHFVSICARSPFSEWGPSPCAVTVTVAAPWHFPSLFIPRKREANGFVDASANSVIAPDD